MPLSTVASRCSYPMTGLFSRADTLLCSSFSHVPNVRELVSAASVIGNFSSSFTRLVLQL